MVMVMPQLRPIRGYGSARAADENVTVHKERALKKSVALLLGFAALGVAGAETAAAQGLYYGPGGFYGQRYYVPGLAPWRVARIVRSAGLTPLSAPARRGPIYEVVAIDPEGRHMRVAVDAYRGAITSVRPVAVLRPNGEPYGSRVAVAPPASPEQDDMVPGSRLGPTPSQPGAGRIPPQVLPPYGGPSQGSPSQAMPPQAIPPQGMPQQHAQPPQAQQPSPRVANAPVITGATPPVESQRTPIPRPRPNAAATAAVTPAPSQAPAAAPSAAATAPAEVPEAPPAPIRARPSTPAAAAASASAKAATPAATANTPPATGSTSSAATAKTEPRAPTTMVPVAPLE